MLLKDFINLRRKDRASELLNNHIMSDEMFASLINMGYSNHKNTKVYKVRSNFIINNSHLTVLAFNDSHALVCTI